MQSLPNPFITTPIVVENENRFVLDEDAFMAAITELADPRRERFGALVKVARAARADYEENKIEHNLDPARYPFALLEKLRLTLEEAEAAMAEISLPKFLSDPRPEYLAATHDPRIEMRLQFATARQFQPIFDLFRAA